MGNPTLFYPGDDPTPCWTCAHFLGLHTGSAIRGVTVNCSERGQFCQAAPDRGCRHWAPDPAVISESP